MKIYDIVTSRKYAKNDAEKTAWSNVGKLIKFEATTEKPEGFVLELNMFPNTKFNIFEQKAKTVASPIQNTTDPFFAPTENEMTPKQDKIQLENIPF